MLNLRFPEINRASRKHRALKSRILLCHPWKDTRTGILFCKFVFSRKKPAALPWEYGFDPIVLDLSFCLSRLLNMKIAGFRGVAAVHLFLFATLPRLSLAQDDYNSWTKPTSGNWEEQSYWSLNQL